MKGRRLVKWAKSNMDKIKNIEKSLTIVNVFLHFFP